MRHDIMRSAVLAAALLLNIPAGRAANAERDVQLQPIGSEVKTNLSLSYAQAPRTLNVRRPDATFIKIHIAALDLAPGDFVTVSAGGETHRLSSAPTRAAAGRRGFWALSVLGDTATIELHNLSGSGSDRPGAAVLIDKYAYGFSAIARPSAEAPESVCGRTDYLDAACYRSSNPTEYSRGQAVARLIFQRSGASYTCTAWRVGPNADTMLTNQHCLGNQTVTDTAELWFNYQTANCGSGSTTGSRVIVSANRLLTSDSTLDFALFTIENASAVAGFGALSLDARVPVLNEKIYIPQHPGGSPKKLGIFSDQNGGDYCNVDRTPVAGNGSNTDLAYYCDTAGGSSGSPVLARSTNKVIGLHHFGGCLNSGVRIDLIWPRISSYLGGRTTGAPGAPNDVSAE